MTSLSMRDAGGVRSPGRLTVRAIGMDAALDIVSGLSLRTFVTAPTMRRRPSVAADRGRAMRTTATTAGLSVERAGAAALILDYDRIDGTPFGQGYRMTLADTGPGLMAGRIGWSVSAMALQRSPDTTVFAFDRGTADLRVEAHFGFAF